MKLIVFGSTGGIGSQVIRRRLPPGHTSCCRPQPCGNHIQHERLIVSRAICLTTYARPAIAGQDAGGLGLVFAPHAHTVYSRRRNIMRRGRPNVRACCVSPHRPDPGPLVPALAGKPSLRLSNICYPTSCLWRMK